MILLVKNIEELDERESFNTWEFLLASIKKALQLIYIII